MKNMMLTLAAAAMTGLSGCASPASASPMIAAVASDAVVAMPRLLTVTGQGEARAKPDMASISVGVQTTGPTAAAALSANSKQAGAIIARLDKLGVDDKDMQTSNVSIHPNYRQDSSGRRQPEIVGYTASNGLNVKVRKLNKLGRILDEVTQSGANRLNGLSFGFQNPKPLMNKAREDAVKDAMAKAKLYANAANVSLGPVISITEPGAARPPSPVMMRMESTVADQSVPIQAGESGLNSSISMTFELN